jgi:hypothetical protein
MIFIALFVLSCVFLHFCSRYSSHYSIPYKWCQYIVWKIQNLFFVPQYIVSLPSAKERRKFTKTL